MRNLPGAQLITCLLITAVHSKEEAVFIYSQPGRDVLLPCALLASSSSSSSSSCSFITWTYFKDGVLQFREEVSGGRVRLDSHRSSRLSITANCSLQLRRIREEDAGSYGCVMSGGRKTNVYLSLVSITSSSSVTQLQPGGRLSLSCLLFTYYDTGSCKAYSTAFNLSWADGEGARLHPDNRTQLIQSSRCNVTVVTTLSSEDHNRRWRCQVETKQSSRPVFLDFTSAFVWEAPGPGLLPPAAGAGGCPVDLPVSRILLCVSLPLMLLLVTVFTRRQNQKTLPQTSAASIELQEIP